MTMEEKQARQKQRRSGKTAKLGQSPDEFEKTVREYMGKLENAFLELSLENEPGKISITEMGLEVLEVEVRKVGNYHFSINPSKQTLTMQSPESGLNVYTWDETNQFWKSQI